MCVCVCVCVCGKTKKQKKKLCFHVYGQYPKNILNIPFLKNKK